MFKIILSFLTLMLTTAISVSSVQAGGIDKELLVRPAGSVAWQGDRAELVKTGEKLWHDPSLSKNNKTTCAGCHKDNKRMFKKSFLEPYPHYVKMPAKKADLDSISAESMVQFCMVAPMKAEILPWDSVELAALTAYTEDVVQKAYIAHKEK